MAKKVLIVDDDRINISLLKFALTEKKYDIVIAKDGDEGLKQVDVENPDLILLDVCMPNMNGYEFMQELKSLQGFETTPVIMVTANETMEDVFKLEGVKGYFVKPLDLPAVITKVRETIGDALEG